MYKFIAINLLLLLTGFRVEASTGCWHSKVTGGLVSYVARESRFPVKDVSGNYVTIVYLENLNLTKAGRSSNKKDVAWLLNHGYRVIELNYAGNKKTIATRINEDIIAINDSIAAGLFCGFKDCSLYQSYILFEGYRIQRNVPYFKDDPSVYNTPAEYTQGDTLHMDIIYPAHTRKPVPVILSFSYVNSYATYNSKTKQLVNDNKDQRLNLAFSLAGFDDSFLEGAPAHGIAWAIADHPKYCPWGKGKPVNGPNDAYKSFQTNPDAVQKVKSAIRTLRKRGTGLGLSGEIGIFGFSRGSTAGSLAIGDRKVPAFENAGFNIGVPDNVQAAVLGPGVFDYTRIYNSKDDGDGNLETRCPLVWGPLAQNYEHWQSMGAIWLMQSAQTSPTLLFYNTSDEHYYQDQIRHLKTRLDSLGVPNESVIDYGKGHSLPQSQEALTGMYHFFTRYLRLKSGKAK